MDEREQTFFGIKFFQKDKEKQENRDNSSNTFVPPSNVDGATVIDSQNQAAGSAFNYTFNLEQPIKNEIDLIQRYRGLALNHDADSAIDDIVNDAVVFDEQEEIVEIDLDGVDGINDQVKDKIREEFDKVLKLLDFKDRAYQYFRQWYIDGRLYFHKIPHKDSTKKGLKEVRKIDPINMKKVQVVEREPMAHNSGVNQVRKSQEFYIYNPGGNYGKVSNVGLKIDPTAISFIHSGLLDSSSNIIISYLHKAIKPLNQLRMVEDSAVIYRIARAPERRIFYIDVANMTPSKAEAHVQKQMQNFKTKLSYDASTGEVDSDRRNMSMLEDFFLPRTSEGRGTEVQTLPSGQNLGEIEDIRYFQRLFYKALNVPVTRLEPEMNTTLGRTIEVTRDELKFHKFIKRLQARFAYLFEDLLMTQLLLKGIVDRKEWESIKKDICYVWAKDSYFSESKKQEIWRERLSLVRDASEYEGTFFSREWIQKNVLNQSEDEIKEERKKIEAEIKSGIIKDPKDDTGF